MQGQLSKNAHASIYILAWTSKFYRISRNTSNVYSAFSNWFSEIRLWELRVKSCKHLQKTILVDHKTWMEVDERSGIMQTRETHIDKSLIMSEEVFFQRTWDRLRDHPGLMQGWESVFWGGFWLLGSPKDSTHRNFWKYQESMRIHTLIIRKYKESTRILKSPKLLINCRYFFKDMFDPFSLLMFLDF